MIAIKGIGKIQAKKIADGKKIIKKKKGFFAESEESELLVSKSITELLTKIGAFSEEELSEEQMKEIEPYFDFNISKNKMGKYAKLFERLNDLGAISRLIDIDFQKPSRDYKFYFGQMTEIKFGYRQNVLKTMSEKGGLGDVAGIKGSLGGVYGNLKDEEDFAMIVFESDVYQNKKFDIEHCAGEWIIAKANHIKRTTNIFCKNAWIGKELLECELPDFEPNLLRITRDVSVVECDACELRKECTKPVSPSAGRYNAMIIGEAPGKDEDKAGIGFVGRAGNQILWPELGLHKLYPQMFHITNVVKCWPSSTKTPTKKHISVCSNILKEEIEALKPIIVLAVGNTCVKFFKDQDSGIIALNGTTEWSDRYECWICWCIHPASVLYSESNRSVFKEGISNFANKLRYIGYKSPVNARAYNCPLGRRFGKDNNTYSECNNCRYWRLCAEYAINFDWNHKS